MTPSLVSRGLAPVLLPERFITAFSLPCRYFAVSWSMSETPLQRSICQLCHLHTYVLQPEYWAVIAIALFKNL